MFVAKGGLDNNLGSERYGSEGVTVANTNSAMRLRIRVNIVAANRKADTSLETITGGNRGATVALAMHPMGRLTIYGPIGQLAAHR